MVNYDAVKRAPLKDLINDDRKILLMSKLSHKTNLLNESDRIQRFFFKYEKAYEELISTEKGTTKIASLVAKDNDVISEEDYNLLDS